MRAEANGITISLINCWCKINVHSHSYSTDWSFDKTGHWHDSVCGCSDAVDGYSKHVYTKDYISNMGATIKEDGTKSRFCDVCRYEDKVTDIGTMIRTEYTVSEFLVVI